MNIQKTGENVLLRVVDCENDAKFEFRIKTSSVTLMTTKYMYIMSVNS